MPKYSLEMSGVGFSRDGRAILSRIDWRVRPGETWIVLGPNGCGKSTLAGFASFRLHPSTGRVKVLGNEIGKVDIRPLRRRVGTSSGLLADQIRAELKASEVVVCGTTGALEPWWHTYSSADRADAFDALSRVGCASLAEREFGSLSSGERQRVLLARSVVTKPELLVLDEPNAGLDLGGREQLIETLEALASPTLATLLITHHLEEIPPSATHLLALREGSVVAQGAISETLTAPLVSEVFGVEVEVSGHRGRWSARAI